MFILTIADLMMGIYLLVIAYVDLTYSATFHEIISEWTNGIPCILLGLVNFISSEVSLMMLSLLSFARVISVDKLGGMSLLKSKIRIACICIWSIAVKVGIFYVVYIFTNNMGLRNNMCIFFGVSNQRLITNFEVIFQIGFICINIFLLIVLSSSMLSIIRIVITSNHVIIASSGQQNVKFQKSRLRRACSKLFMMLVCNVFTWLPFLIVSILLLCGIGIYESVLQWVIVLGIPLCATTDRILYNMATVKSYFDKKENI